MLQFLHTKFTLLAESQEEQAKEEDEKRRQRKFFQEQFKLGNNEELITCTVLLSMKKIAISRQTKHFQFLLLHQSSYHDFFSTDYLCALKRGIVQRPGWMYLSKKHLCFSSKMLKEKLVLSFQEITSIEKYDTTFSLGNGIIVKTKDNEVFLSVHSVFY
jgi:hypothetical protein